MVSEALIPKKIRKMRLDRGWTQQELAVAIDVTKGYISRIENSNTSPPVGILIAVAKAFGVTMFDFFDSEEESTYVCITRKENRPEIARDEKASARFEHLALNFPKRAFDAFIMSAPGHSKLSRRTQHKGQEMLFVLKGEVDFTVNDKTYHLYEGDTIYFDSTYTHFGRCTVPEGCELLLVIFDDSKIVPTRTRCCFPHFEHSRTSGLDFNL